MAVPMAASNPVNMFNNETEVACDSLLILFNLNTFPIHPNHSRSIKRKIKTSPTHQLCHHIEDRLLRVIHRPSTSTIHALNDGNGPAKGPGVPGLYGVRPNENCFFPAVFLPWQLHMLPRHENSSHIPHICKNNFIKETYVKDIVTVMRFLLENGSTQRKPIQC